MTEVIAYEDTGVVKVVVPTQESGLTVEEIAQVVVPDGVSYITVDDSELPSRDCRDGWSITGGAVVIPSADVLAQAVSEKKTAVKALYAAKCAACTHLTYTWQADALSVGRIVAKHHVLESDPPINTTWVDADNTVRTIAWADFTSLKDRLYNFHEDAFANMHAHKAAIDALETVQAAEAYDTSTGWPT